MNRTLSRTARTLLQLVAAGGLTGLVGTIAVTLSPASAGILLAASTLGIVAAQNLLEATGRLPTLLEDAHARQDPPA